MCSTPNIPSPVIIAGTRRLPKKNCCPGCSRRKKGKLHDHGTGEMVRPEIRFYYYREYLPNDPRAAQGGAGALRRKIRRSSAVLADDQGGQYLVHQGEPWTFERSRALVAKKTRRYCHR